MKDHIFKKYAATYKRFALTQGVKKGDKPTRQDLLNFFAESKEIYSGNTLKSKLVIMHYGS